MSGSDRDDHSKAALIGAALVAILGVALYWSMFWNAGYQSGYNERKANVEAEHYASDTAEQIDRKCGAETGVAARKCITDIVKAERESQRGESDLEAQWKAADWVMWAGVLAGAQLIATALGLYFVKRTLDATLEAVEETVNATKAMDRQNDIAEDTSKRQLRAYLSVTPVAIGGFDPQGWILVEHKVTNHGQTPAHEINHVFGMGVFPATPPMFSSVPDATRPVSLNSSLFPGVEMKIWHNNNRSLTQTEVDSIILHQTHRFYIWGSLTYRDAFGEIQKTEFTTSVGGPDYAASIMDLREGGTGLPFNWNYGDGHNRST